MPRYTHVGTLQEVLTEVAWRIKQHANGAIQVAWLDEGGTVYVASIESAPDISPDCFIGSYSQITTLDDIEEDLRSAQIDRAGGRLYVVDKTG